MNSLNKMAKKLSVVFLTIVITVAFIPSSLIAEEKTETKRFDNPTERLEVFSKSGKIQPIEVDSSIFNDASKSKSNKSKDSQTEETYDFESVDIVNNGSDEDKYCLLFAGDGYTASEQEKFLAKVRESVEYFMAQSPFNESDFNNMFNIRAVCVTSNESGTSLDPDKPFDTFFKATFNNGVERAVCVHDYDRVWNIVNQYMPECVCPVIICNSEKYGGTGGSVCCVSANEDVADVLVHEFGHTAADLADEYWENESAAGIKREAPNRTCESNPDKCKWADLIGKNGVGLYPFSEESVYDCFRPHQSCKMRYLYEEFCGVCKRQIRKVLNARKPFANNTNISSANDLKTFLDKVGNGVSTTGKTFTLTNDIYIDETIDTVGRFNGTFDGNGYKISGLRVSVEGDGAGLFKELGKNGHIKNLELDNTTIEGSGIQAGLVGICKGGIIEQCSFSGSVTACHDVGGIVGQLDEGIVKNCYNLGTIKATNTSGAIAGGIVGWQNNGIVKNCYSKGKLLSEEINWCGGVVGNSGNINPINCYFLSGNGSTIDGSTKTTEDGFSDGSLAKNLRIVNNVWGQGREYPILKNNNSEEEVMDIDIRFDVSEYKSSEKYKFPKLKGMLFAGWYADSDYKTVYNATTGKAYARFIDANMLDVKFQVKKEENIITAVRIVSSIDRLDYLKAGFTIWGEYGDSDIKSQDKSVKSAYYSIRAAEEKLLPSVFDRESNYFITYTIRKLEKIQFYIDVTPFFVTPDGTKVTGIERSYDHYF